MLTRRHVALVGAVLTLTLSPIPQYAYAQAQGPSAAPGRFTTAGLDRIRAHLERDVATGRIAGAVVILTRAGGPIREIVVGQQDVANNRPMARDSVFRIASMTKPFVSVAAMMLVEQGRMQMNDPVTMYLPELQGLKVQTETRDAAGQVTASLVDARPITIQDLFRHTSGLSYSFLRRGTAIERGYEAAGIESLHGPAAAEALRRLQTVPLMFQPGTTFEYSISTDVLGHVVERITGKTLDVALDEMLFRPLGMRDSVFHVAGPRLARLAQMRPGVNDPDAWAMQWLDVTRQPTRFSGGAGAASTAPDYARFMRMLLNGGEFDGVRILSPATVRYMLSDHLGSIRGPIYLPGPGHGFGLGFAVRTDDGLAVTIGGKGQAWWGGITGPRFWVDPANDLGVVIMIAQPGQRNYYQSVLRNLVYGAMGRAAR